MSVDGARRGGSSGPLLVGGTPGTPSGRAVPAPPHEVSLAVVIQDSSGLLHRVPAGTVPTDGAVHDLRMELTGAGRGVSGGLLSVEVTSETPAPQGLPGADALPS